MLAFAIWIYEFGEEVRPDQPTLTFSYGINLKRLQDQTKEAVEHVIYTQQSGSVARYIDDIRNGLQVAMTVNPRSRQIVLAFRGSDEEYDWTANAKSYKSCLNGKIYVHTGFLQLIESHSSPLNRTMDELLAQHPGFTISMTGHSLGGALCTLFGYLTAQRLAEKGTKVSVVSFASPRVGNYYFRRACDSTTNLSITRVSYRHDIVTAMPMLNYYHVGKTVVHLNKQSVRVFQDYKYSIFRYSLFCCWSVSDHSTASYWSALKTSAEDKNTVDVHHQLIDAKL